MLDAGRNSVKLFGNLRKRSGQDEEAGKEVPTQPLPPAEQQPAEVQLPPLHYEPAQLISGCGQSIGQQRDHNEDALFMLTCMLTSDHTALPFGIYIVADGMGGHQHGEMASKIAIHSMAGYLIQRLYLPLLDPQPEAPEETIQEIMQVGVHEAQKEILKHVPGGGTTLTAALILGEQVTIAHVGDSRAYLIHTDGRFETLTRDHSLVKRLVELGQITDDEAAVHPQRNVLYRALGQGEPFDADIYTFPLPAGGCLLLCSDGLWGLVPENEMQGIILAASTPHEACRSLVQAANDAGGPDNITAVLVRLPG
jgi:protein phosphatase